LHFATVMEVLRPLFDLFAAHVYLVVFAGALIDSTGLPFPGRLLLAAAGAQAAAGNVSVLAVIGLGAAGAMITDQAWFWTATRGSAWLLDTYCRLTRRPRGCADDSVEAVAKYRAPSVVLGRFFTMVRVAAWPVAVRNGLTWARFTALDLLGALTWATTWVGLGWIVGDRWQSAAQSATGWLALAGAVFVAGLAAPLALRTWRRRTRGV
jgi:membrane protein DedA with SNARE-associated domain